LSSTQAESATSKKEIADLGQAVVAAQSGYEGLRHSPENAAQYAQFKQKWIDYRKIVDQVLQLFTSGHFGRYNRGSNVSGIVGTGVGLYLVKMVIDLHGGTVAVESREDEGSRFTVRLPIWRPSQTEILSLSSLAG
jgi:K+-sensing histidine kinase KdpD